VVMADSKAEKVRIVAREQGGLVRRTRTAPDCFDI